MHRTRGADHYMNQTLKQGAEQRTAPAIRRRVGGALQDLRSLRTSGPLAILPILIIIFEILNPRFLAPQNLANIASDASTILVLAVAQTFVIMMGSIDLSLGAVVTVTGVTAAQMLPTQGGIAILLALVFGAVAGLINGFLFAYGRLPSFLVTLGTMYAFNGLALFITNGASIAMSAEVPFADLFGGDFYGIPSITLWAALVLVLAVLVARFTRIGRYAYVIGDAEPVAQLSGVRVRRYKLYVFIAAGVLAAFAGILLIYRNYGGDPTMGNNYLLPMIAAVVMGGTPLSGGMGGPGRTLLGVLIISVITNGMVLASVQPYLQTVIQGLVVVAAVALAIDRKRLATVK